MSTLRVRVDMYLPSDGGPPPDVFARIQRLDERGRSVAQSLRHELVPISNNPGQARALTVQPGDYAIEVRLPSGEVLTDAIRIGDEVADVVLVAEPSSHEWLGWQRLAGNTGSAEQMNKSARPRARGDAPARSREMRRREQKSRDDLGAAGGAVPGPGSVIRDVSEVLQRVGLRMADGLVRSLGGEPDVARDPERPAEIEVDHPLYWLGADQRPTGVDLLRTDPWNALSELRGSTEDIIHALTRKVSLIEATASDDAMAVFRIPSSAGWGDNAFAPANRNFVAVHRSTGVELACVPTPWVDQWSGREVPVEIGVQRPRYESEFASSVVVRDQHLAVLLGFLASGALPAAKRLAETAGSMLYEKNDNPLAAAAGGYALVSSAVDAQPKPWHGWVQNLMQRFGHVPDGAIQYGTMRLRLRSSASDLKEASDAFKLAYRRGLPFYGLGMRWLLEGLQRIGTQDEEAKEMAQSVERMTARLHPQSPFTILRLGRR